MTLLRQRNASYQGDGSNGNLPCENGGGATAENPSSKSRGLLSLHMTILVVIMIIASVYQQRNGGGESQSKKLDSSQPSLRSEDIRFTRAMAQATTPVTPKTNARTASVPPNNTKAKHTRQAPPKAQPKKENKGDKLPPIHKQTMKVIAPDHPTWTAESVHEEFQKVIKKIEDAPIIHEPFDHFSVNGLFSDHFYQALMKELPPPTVYTPARYPGTDPFYRAIHLVKNKTHVHLPEETVYRAASRAMS